MDKPELTPAERRVLKSYRKVRREIGMPPTSTEIAEDLGITKQSAHEYMQRLEMKGVFTRSTRRSRSLELTRTPRPSMQTAKRTA